jgi:hypothetical protein
MPDTKKQVRVRLREGTLAGEMLLEGQRIVFTVRIDGPKVDAEFADPEVDQWTAFRALDRWIDENLRG